MSNTPLSYPTERMRQTAQQIRANAQDALSAHSSAWQRVNALIDSFPGFMQPALRTVLDPHDKRFRDSYQWQIDFADRLENAADSSDTTEQQVKQQF